MAASSGFALFAALLFHYGRDLPDIEAALAAYDPPQVTRILARDGETALGEVFEERRTIVGFERIPQVLLKAVVASEDADFYRHEGLDYPGLARALWANVLAGGYVQGGSTITQQVVKNLLLTPEQTMERKFKELLLARELEQTRSKDEILALYLNHINFGDGRYGVEEACRYYFGEHVWEIDLAQAALLAGIPKAPSHYSPFRDADRARERRRYVLGQMAAQSLVSEEEARAADAAPLGVVERPPSRAGLAPELIAWARRALEGRASAERLRRGGFEIHTTIDAKLQTLARAALRKGLERIDQRHGDRAPFTVRGTKRLRPDRERPRLGRTQVGTVVGADDSGNRLEMEVGGVRGFASLDTARRWNPEKLPPSRFAEVGARLRVTPLRAFRQGEPIDLAFDLGPQGAVVVLEPESRAVLAIVGGYEVPALGFDRASQARRQPGSAFKPIVYAEALQRRIVTPATIIADAPEVFDRWRPRNYESWSHRGPIPVREAVAQSVNLVAVKVLRDVGPERVVELARSLGVESPLRPDLALALGASEVTPLELTNAFAAFASGGFAAEPRLIGRIVDPDGRDLRRIEAASATQVLDPAVAFLVTSLLTSVVEEGTATAARSLRRPAAGKTGTSNEARDAWFVGYTPDLVCGVWIGYDDRRPLGRGEAGGRTALPVWIDFMRGALASRPRAAFPLASGVVTARIDPASGLLAYEGQEDARDEYFLEGTVPTETALPPDVTTPDEFLLQEGGEAPSSASGTDPSVPAPTEEGAVVEPAPAPAEEPERTAAPEAEEGSTP